MAAADIQILNDVENKFLGRRELVCLFPLACGLAKRSDLAKAVAKKVHIDPKHMFVSSLEGSAGTRDLKGVIFAYEDMAQAKRQLPPHIFLRMEEKKPAEGKPAEGKPEGPQNERVSA